MVLEAVFLPGETADILITGIKGQRPGFFSRVISLAAAGIGFDGWKGICYNVCVIYAWIGSGGQAAEGSRIPC
jgi:hypothetical protein